MSSLMTIQLLYGMKETEEGLQVDWEDDRGVYLHVTVKKTYKLRMKA